MWDVERHLDPLHRPPVALSVLAAALKYLATAAILGEPLLWTRGGYQRRRSGTGGAALSEQWVRLVVRLLFLTAAADNLRRDLHDALAGFDQLPAWRAFHLAAMVLVFSPNAVVALAAVCNALLKVFWYRASLSRTAPSARALDCVAWVSLAFMVLLYLLPLLLVSVVHGALGGALVLSRLLWEVVLLPWRLYTGSLGDGWMVVPVFVAFALANVLVAGIVATHALLVEWRYPELSHRSVIRGHALKLVPPQQVPAHVVGCARELAALAAPTTMQVRHVELDLGDADEELLESLPAEHLERDAASLGDGTGDAVAPGDRCLLNDELLACLCYVKVSLCLLLPILQVSVVVAAKVYLGAGLWHAPVEAFGERGWEHYLQHIREADSGGLWALLWYYF